MPFSLFIIHMVMDAEGDQLQIYCMILLSHSVGQYILAVEGATAVPYGWMTCAIGEEKWFICLWQKAWTDMKPMLMWYLLLGHALIMAAFSLSAKIIPVSRR